MKGRLHHIEIYVSDLKKTKLFWSWLLTHVTQNIFYAWSSSSRTFKSAIK